MKRLWRDIQYGLRLMRRTPGFTMTVTLVLALGIGATTSLFSLVDIVMLKPLPVKNPQQLIQLKWNAATTPSKGIRRQWSGYEATASFSYPSFEMIRFRNHVCSDVFGFAPLGSVVGQALAVRVSSRTISANGEVVTGNFFSALGIRPAIGRFFTEEDSRKGASRVVVISYSFWTREFNRNPKAMGQSMFLDTVPYTVVGATPSTFFGIQPGRPSDFWVPISQWPQAQGRMNDQTQWWLTVMGRLKPGVSARQAGSELDALYQQSLTADMDSQMKPADVPHLELLPGSRGLDLLRHLLGKPLLVSIVLVGLVLLIACANVSILMLGRVTARRKEIAVRLALGALRSTMARQLLVESLLLAAGGVILGSLFAYWSSRILVVLMSGLAGPMGLKVQLTYPDLAVIGFSIGLAVLAGVLCALIPAWHASHTEALSALKNSADGLNGGPLRVSTREILVIAQVAVSLVVVIASGLLVWTLQNLEHTDLGFEPRNVLVFSVNASAAAGYVNWARVPAIDLYERLLQRIQTIDGVESASSSMLTPMCPFDSAVPISVEGHRPESNGEAQVGLNLVGPSFFKTMGIRIVQGRSIDWNDLQSSRMVAVVNEAMVHRFFQKVDVIGQRFGFGGNSKAIEIIGVAQNAKYHDVREDPSPRMYLPYASLPGIVTSMPAGMFFEVRSTRHPASLVATIRSLVQQVDSSLVVNNVTTEEEQLNSSLAHQRLLARMSTFFGCFVLLLSCTSLYGIQSYTVERRAREFGIRMSLGAQRRQILLTVLRRSFLIVIVGIAIGLAIAFAATRFIASQLYGVAPTDPAVYGIAAIILLGVALGGSYIPARRATRVDPAAVMRYE